MPDQKPLLQTPHQRAAIATAAVLLLLGIFAFAGFWYGKKASETTETTAGNTNTQNLNQGGSTGSPSQNAISGTITKILENGIEIQTKLGETIKTVTANITKDTILRKLDFRTIPKNGVGDGVPIKKTDLKVGLNVVVLTLDASTEKINAQKLSMVIYP
ncbi:hypothetical protein C4546_02590 [Candidatus Parcubacteria bacterium]|jgi:hypothetical protein|nr:MAG: hypothetical protein C4546_02590 [Candidatus Parcubacteria bacterium]